MTDDLRKQDFFGGSLWVETNQDAAYSFTRYRQLFDTINCRLQDGFAIAEHKLGTQKVVQVGRGKAVYLNLSPQRYLQYREEGTDTDAHRATFLRADQPRRPPAARGGYKPRAKAAPVRGHLLVQGGPDFTSSSSGTSP